MTALVRALYQALEQHSETVSHLRRCKLRAYVKHEDGAASAKWAVQLQDMMQESPAAGAPTAATEVPAAPRIPPAPVASEPQAPDPIETYATYGRAWNADDPDERAALLRSVWGDRAEYVDDEVPDGLRGADSLLGYMAASHTEMPGLVVSDTSAPKLLDGRLLVRWRATQEGEQRYSGTDIVEFASDGRISRVTNFYDG